MNPDLELRITGKNQTATAFAGVRQELQRTGQSLTGTEMQLSKIGLAVGGLPALFKASLVGAGVAAAETLTRAIAGTIGEVAQLGIEAKRAGLGVEIFQQWKEAARLSKVDTSALIDGFKEVQLRADEYIASGSGSAAASFKRLGLSREEVKERLKDPSDFMLELIERTRELGNTAAGIRIFDELLGGSGGEQFVAFLEKGREGIDDMMDGAVASGKVLKSDIIDQAAIIDQQFNEIANTIGFTLKKAIVETAVEVKNLIDAMPNKVAVDNLRMGLMAQRFGSQNNDWIAEYGAMFDGVDLSKMQPVAAKPKVDNRGVGAGKFSEFQSTFVIGKDDDDDNRGASRVDAYQQVIDSLKQENELLGLNTREREKQTEIRRAGVDGASQEAEAIRNLVDQRYDVIEANDALESSQDALNDLMGDFADTGQDAVRGLIDALKDGKITGEEFNDILGQMLDSLIDIGLNSLFGSFGSGGGVGKGGLLGGLIIPGILHDGGSAGVDGYGHGKAYSASLWNGAQRYHSGGIAGMMPDEIPAILQRGERVLPRDFQESMKYAEAATGEEGKELQFVRRSA